MSLKVLLSSYYLQGEGNKIKNWGPNLEIKNVGGRAFA
jgi:hypothetical protein